MNKLKVMNKLIVKTQLKLSANEASLLNSSQESFFLLTIFLSQSMSKKGEKQLPKTIDRKINSHPTFFRSIRIYLSKGNTVKKLHKRHTKFFLFRI